MTITDTFADTKTPGTVVGSLSPSGVLRRGADVEGLIAVAGDQLILPIGLATNGWARAGVAYGPYARTDGLCLICKIVDGDVQAQQVVPSIVNEHLAVGWFSAIAPANPITDGSALIFRNNGSNCLIARNGSDGVNQTDLISNAALMPIKQVVWYFVIALWSGGARYYVAALPNTRGLPAAGYPTMQLVHVASTNLTMTPLYAGAWQRHGQSGATRVDGVDVVTSAAWSAAWYATAHLADALVSPIGNVTDGLNRTADIGGSWYVKNATITASGIGVKTIGAAWALRMDGSNGTTAPSAPAGVISFQVTSGATLQAIVELLFRSDAAVSDYWELVFDANGAVKLARSIGGIWAQQQSFPDILLTNATCTVTIVDDGSTITIWRDQRIVIQLTDTTHASQTGIYFFMSNERATTFIKNVEVHPRSMTMPIDLQTLGDPAADWPLFGTTTIYTDTFGGSAGDITGTPTTTGGGVWAATFGTAGAIKLNGSGNAYRDGTIGTSGAILRTVPWFWPSFGDLEIHVTPPGAAYGLGENGRPGLVFWQDNQNWIGARLYVDDNQLNSAEIEIYLVWGGVYNTVLRRVNFGTEINHGVITHMRMTFDGDRFICYKLRNSVWEPVHVWKISWQMPTHTGWWISRVGLLCSFEDTGSHWSLFRALSDGTAPVGAAHTDDAYYYDTTGPAGAITGGIVLPAEVIYD